MCLYYSIRYTVNIFSLSVFAMAYLIFVFNQVNIGLQVLQVLLKKLYTHSTLKQSYKRTFSNSCFLLSASDIDLSFCINYKYVPFN